MSRINIYFSDLSLDKKTTIGISTNNLSEEKFKEKLPKMLIDFNWRITSNAILFVNGEIKKLT